MTTFLQPFGRIGVKDDLYLQPAKKKKKKKGTVWAFVAVSQRTMSTQEKNQKKTRI